MIHSVEKSLYNISFYNMGSEASQINFKFNILLIYGAKIQTLEKIPIGKNETFSAISNTVSMTTSELKNQKSKLFQTIQ